MLSFMASAAMFLYSALQYHSAWKPKIDDYAGGQNAGVNLFLASVLLATLSAFICAAVGSFLSKRYNLPGEGDLKDLPRLWKLYLPAGLIAMPLGYFMHDRIFLMGTAVHGWAPIVPDSLPKAGAQMLHGVFFKEVVFRFGMLTLFAGLFRGNRNWWAVGGTAAFTAGMSIKELSFAGHAVGYDLTTLSAFGWALIINAALGAVYIKKGLWPAMALRACIDIRYFIYPFLNIFVYYQ